jgi:hypothetical protein
MKAFPTTKPLDSWGDPNAGMDLRDYFAAKALPPLLQDYLKSMDWLIDVPMEHFSMATKVAYQIADEMIKARK